MSRKNTAFEPNEEILTNKFCSTKSEVDKPNQMRLIRANGVIPPTLALYEARRELKPPPRVHKKI